MFEQMEAKLFELTPSELNYRQGTGLPDYRHAPTTQIGNLTVLHFSREAFLPYSDQDFYIRKQSRFAPVPEHVTEIIELNYVYSGSCIQKVNGQEIILFTGDLLIVDTGVAHAANKIGEDDIIISININQKFFKDHFINQLSQQSELSHFLFQAIRDSQHHNQYLLFRAKDSRKLHLLFQQLMSEVYEPSLMQTNVQSHLLQLIMLELICSFSVESNLSGTDHDKRQFILELLTYIDSHYLTASLDDCAKQFGYNPSYLSHMISKTFGSTFKSLLQQKRLEESIPLLLHSDKSIRDISLDVGFTSLNQYYKIFQSRYKQTPASYRKHHKSKEHKHD